jgi:hypothetical protein
MKMRRLSHGEQTIVEAIARAVPSDLGEGILRDLPKSQVEEANRDGSRLIFWIEGYERPKDRGQHPFPIEGSMKDGDGADLHVLLHADQNERLYELEFVRWVGGPVVGPDWSSFQLCDAPPFLEDIVPPR